MLFVVDATTQATLTTVVCGWCLLDEHLESYTAAPWEGSLGSRSPHPIAWAANEPYGGDPITVGLAVFSLTLEASRDPEEMPLLVQCSAMAWIAWRDAPITKCATPCARCGRIAILRPSIFWTRRWG